MRQGSHSYLLLAFIFLIASCTSSKTLSTKEELYPVEIPLSEVINKIPNYTEKLVSAKGKGRALVSEPGNSDRITIDFETDTALSLLTFKNRIGITGGSMLVDSDSILIYNKIDKYAQKVSVQDGRMTNLNELASVNLLDLMNFKIKQEDVERILQSDTEYVLGFYNKGIARINKKDGTVSYVEQARSSGLPYSSLTYESYGVIDGYTLPRKITILSADRNSQVVFQVRSLEINPNSIDLKISIPNDIAIERL
ncbi:MAG: DUF4292 domain-containing protein [Balneola sp.]